MIFYNYAYVECFFIQKATTDVILLYYRIVCTYKTKCLLNFNNFKNFVIEKTNQKIKPDQHKKIEDGQTEDRAYIRQLRHGKQGVPGQAGTVPPLPKLVHA